MLMEVKSHILYPQYLYHLKLCRWYTRGFEIKKNDQIIFHDQAGVVGVSGANNNDNTTGLVYNYTKTINLP